MSETTPSFGERPDPPGATVCRLPGTSSGNMIATGSKLALFAPADRREALFALYAFNYEIARIREAVREEMLGRIRLQWWREVVEARLRRSRARRCDTVEMLSEAINRYDLTQTCFERLIDARGGRSARGAVARPRGARRVWRGEFRLPRPARRRGVGLSWPDGDERGARGRDRLWARRSVAGDAVSRRRGTLVPARRIRRRSRRLPPASSDTRVARRRRSDRQAQPGGTSPLRRATGAVPALGPGRLSAARRSPAAISGAGSGPIDDPFDRRSRGRIRCSAGGFSPPACAEDFSGRF